MSTYVLCTHINNKEQILKMLPKISKRKFIAEEIGLVTTISTQEDISPKEQAEILEKTRRWVEMIEYEASCLKRFFAKKREALEKQEALDVARLFDSNPPEWAIINEYPTKGG